jgi:hypothetical protein
MVIRLAISLSDLVRPQRRLRSRTQAAAAAVDHITTSHRHSLAMIIIDMLIITDTRQALLTGTSRIHLLDRLIRTITLLPVWEAVVVAAAAVDCRHLPCLR